MIDALDDVLSSLLLLMEEETQYIRQCPFGSALPELAATKLRLISQLEQITARIARSSDWATSLDPATRDSLTALIGLVEQVAAANGAALKRQIDLSGELIGAIVDEAKRQAGRTTATYGAGGMLARFDPTMPIAINSEF